ncbi:MAG: RNA-binding protein [Anaerolineae bacterium]|nr:RNA-binding protein [Anaerolineae bacterium]
MLCSREVNELKRLYVGNLNYRTTEAELEAKFAEAGNVVSTVILTDRMTGRSRGFGFVEYETEEEAQAAMQMLNGQEFAGRTLRVDLARDRSNDAPRRRSTNRY